MNTQRAYNEEIAKKINADTATAFMCATNVKRLLAVPVKHSRFLELVAICHAVGIERFASSIVLKMINGGHPKAGIRVMLSRMSSGN